MRKSGRSSTAKKIEDNNVKRIYELEEYELPVGEKLRSIGDVRRLVNMVVRSDVWNVLGNVPNAVRVFDWGDSEYSMATDDHAIWLARHHRNVASVLHELAHIACPRTKHGKQWVRTYLMLVTYFMGTFYADLYTKAFKREGIRF